MKSMEPTIPCLCKCVVLWKVDFSLSAYFVLFLWVRVQNLGPMPLRAASGCSLRHPCLLCRTNKNSWAWKHGPEPGETAALTVASLWLSTDSVVGLGVNYVLCNCVWYVEGKRRTMILNTDYPNTSQTLPPWRSGWFQWLFLLLVLTQGTNFPILFSSMTKNKKQQQKIFKPCFSISFWIIPSSPTVWGQECLHLTEGWGQEQWKQKRPGVTAPLLV